MMLFTSGANLLYRLCILQGAAERRLGEEEEEEEHARDVS